MNVEVNVEVQKKIGVFISVALCPLVHRYHICSYESHKEIHQNDAKTCENLNINLRNLCIKAFYVPSVDLTTFSKNIRAKIHVVY